MLPRTPHDAIQLTQHRATICASAAPCDFIIATVPFTQHERPIRQQNPYNLDSLKMRIPQLAVLTEHDLVIPPGCTAMTTALLCSPNLNNRMDQPPELHSISTDFHNNSSHSFTPMDNELGIQPLLQQQHHTATQRQPLQQFDEEFCIMQQQIHARHLTLKAKIQEFMAFFRQRHDNPSSTALPPPARKLTIGVMYSRSMMFKYFFDTYGNHTQPNTHWHYCI